MRTRFLIIDKHPGFRHDLALYLGLLDVGYEVVGEADTAAGALARIGALAPDIVLTDLDLPDAPGLSVIRRIGATWPWLPVLVFSNNAAADYRGPALAAGAAGYVDKLDLARELPDVLRAVARQGRAPGAPAGARSADLAPLLPQALLAGVWGVALTPAGLTGFCAAGLRALGAWGARGGAALRTLLGAC